MDADTPEPSGGAPAGRLRMSRGGVRSVGALVAATLLTAGAVLLHRVSDVVRGAPIRRVVMEAPLPPPADPRFGALVGEAADAGLRGGNDVEILVDGDVYGRLVADVTDARRSVSVFLYFCEPGPLGDAFAGVLAGAARRGVRVRLLGDGYGCGRYLDAVRPGLDAAGVTVAALRPVRWYALHRVQHRNHGRAVVVDGRVAYTGGFGMADRWVGGGGIPAWREMSVRIGGPVVGELESAFRASWAEATGTMLVAPPAEGEAVSATDRVAAGDGVRAGVLVSRPGLGPSAAERYFALSIAGARTSIHIANSYFVPTPELLGLLVDAARRGVDVRILLPGPVNDVPSTRWAGQSYFGQLLEAGVRLFEYQPSMMHAKWLVVDGVWASVGSMNLDNRSLRLNEEWGLLVHDPNLGATMEAQFAGDLARARERTLAAHRSRPLGERIKEALVRSVAPLL